MMGDKASDFEGKTIFVTGAGAGIGRAIVDEVLARGGCVVAVDVSDEAVDSLSSLGSNVLAVKGSVTDPDFIAGTVEQGVEKFGEINGLVNNAGITRAAMAVKMTVEDFRAVVDVNLTGSFICMQAVGRHMVDRFKAGNTSPSAIVNISSDAGRRGTIGQIGYGASKSGVLGLTMSAAREWGRYGIRVNSACFGVVETQMTETIRGEKFRERYLADIPLNRFMSTNEAARAICILLSEDAAYMTGQNVSFSGGLHITA